MFEYLNQTIEISLLHFKSKIINDVIITGYISLLPASTQPIGISNSIGNLINSQCQSIVSHLGGGSYGAPSFPHIVWSSQRSLPEGKSLTSAVTRLFSVSVHNKYLYFNILQLLSDMKSCERDAIRFIALLGNEEFSLPERCSHGPPFFL